jgi:hypothetical protein
MKIIFSIGLLCVLLLTSECDLFDDFLYDDTTTTPSPTPTLASTKPTPTVTTSTTSTSTKPGVSMTTTSTSTTTSISTSVSTTTAPGGTSTFPFVDPVNFISFFYPSTWQIQKYSDVVAVFKDPESGALIQVAVTDLGYNLTLKDLQTYQKSWVGVNIVGAPVFERSLIGSVPIYETVFNDKELRWRVVSYAIGKKIYDFSFSVKPAFYNKVNEGLNTIMSGFHAPGY